MLLSREDPDVEAMPSSQTKIPSCDFVELSVFQRPQMLIDILSEWPLIKAAKVPLFFS